MNSARTQFRRNSMRGFTLIEMLIVIGVFAIISLSGVGYYRNYAKNITLDAVRDEIIFTLKEARAKSALGDVGSGNVSLKWGVHVVNGGDDYYELYTTPTNYSDTAMEIKKTITLSSMVSINDPTEGGVRDILFDKISGSTTPTTVSFLSEGRVVIVNVTSLGVIY